MALDRILHGGQPARTERETRLEMALRQAIEESGFHVCGPTDWRAAEHGEPKWVCNARAVLAHTTDQTERKG